jgi:hypothetical protein
VFTGHTPSRAGEPVDGFPQPTALAEHLAAVLVVADLSDNLAVQLSLLERLACNGGDLVASSSTAGRGVGGAHEVRPAMPAARMSATASAWPAVSS